MKPRTVRIIAGVTAGTMVVGTVAAAGLAFVL
jgi:hypothetical protein